VIMYPLVFTFRFPHLSVSYLLGASERLRSYLVYFYLFSSPAVIDNYPLLVVTSFRLFLTLIFVILSMDGHLGNGLTSARNITNWFPSSTTIWPSRALPRPGPTLTWTLSVLSVAAVLDTTRCDSAGPM